MLNLHIHIRKKLKGEIGIWNMQKTRFFRLDTTKM